jgi:hypothetical protein
MEEALGIQNIEIGGTTGSKNVKTEKTAKLRAEKSLHSATSIRKGSARKELQAGEYVSLRFHSKGCLRGIGTWRDRNQSIKPAKGHKLSAPEVVVRVVSTSAGKRQKEGGTMTPYFPPGSKIVRARSKHVVESSGHVATRSEHFMSKKKIKTTKKEIANDEKDTAEKKVETKRGMASCVNAEAAGDFNSRQEKASLRSPHAPTKNVCRIVSTTAKIGGTIAGNYDILISFDGELVASQNVTVMPLDVDKSKTSVVALKFIRPDVKSKSVHEGASACGKRFLIILRDRYWNILRPQTGRVLSENLIDAENGVAKTLSLACSVHATTPALQHLRSKMCVERLSKPFYTKEEHLRADFRPSNIDQIRPVLQDVGVSRCRLAAMQLSKERKMMEKLLKPIPVHKLFGPVKKGSHEHANVGDPKSKSSRSGRIKHARKKLLKCPLVDEQNVFALEYVGVPHPGATHLSMDDVLLITRFPLRGVGYSGIVGSDSHSSHDPTVGKHKGNASILLDRNSHIWFPHCSGPYMVNLYMASEQQQGPIQRTNLFSFPISVALRTGKFNTKTKKVPFGSLEWVCMHKVLKRTRMLSRDIFALEIWPSQLHQAFLRNMEAMVLANDQTGGDGPRQQSKAPAAITDAQLSQQLWPREFSLLHGFVDSQHAEAILFVFKKYVYGSNVTANYDLSAFIKGFIQTSRMIDMLDNRKGLLSKISWPEATRTRGRAEGAASSTTENKKLGLASKGVLFNETTKNINLLVTMVRILHKTRMNMQTDQEFLDWWRINGNTSTILSSLSDDWIPTPAEVSDCMHDIVTNIELAAIDDLVSNAVQDVLNALSERFVDEGLDYMIRLREREKAALELESKRENLVRQSLGHFIEQVVEESCENAVSIVQDVQSIKSPEDDNAVAKIIADAVDHLISEVVEECSIKAKDSGIIRSVTQARTTMSPKISEGKSKETNISREKLKKRHTMPSLRPKISESKTKHRSSELVHHTSESTSKTTQPSMTARIKASKTNE